MNWIESNRMPLAEKVNLPTELTLYVNAWNDMQGIDYNALPLIVEISGIHDVEMLLYCLNEIRGFFAKEAEAKRGRV